MTSIIRKSGSIIVGGGITPAGTPSPAGQWSAQHEANTVDFDRDAFTRLLHDKGYAVTWEKAVPCPNVMSVGLTPRDHPATCPFCDGREFLYVSPQETRMLMQGIKLDQAFYAYGSWNMGSMMVTALPEFRLSYYDRLTLTNGVSRFAERVMRQPNATTDKLKYTPLTIEYVAWVNRSKALVEFVDGTNFQAVDGDLEWLTGAPDPESYYTISYTYRPRYVVLDLTHHHRESTVKGVHYEFPVQAVAKLDFLIRNEGRDNESQARDQNPFPG